MDVQVATWNVNSVNARLDNILDWFSQKSPTIVCLQEIKSIEEKFPYGAFEDLGYNVLIWGQKSYNGVAILSKFPLNEEHIGIPNFDDDQARYIQALVEFPDSALRVASIYLPNGNPVETEKFEYKLRWMSALNIHAQALLRLDEPTILAGDYNIIPGDDDVYDPKSWEGDALTRPESRAQFRTLLNQGWQCAFDQEDGRSHRYSYWDYQRGAWQKDHGIRIDHQLLSPQAADMLTGIEIDKQRRAPVDGLSKPSDHVPVIIDLNLS